MTKTLTWLISAGMCHFVARRIHMRSERLLAKAAVTKTFGFIVLWQNAHTAPLGALASITSTATH
jgi:hypothetical protein